MKPRLGVLTLAALILCGALSANAQEKVTLSVAHPYAYATTENHPNAAVFFEATNTGDKDITITGAETTIAKEASLHTMSKEDDVMKMRAVESFTVKPAEALTLSPHGDHIMITDLIAPLKVGGSLEIVLKTTQGDFPFNAVVIAPGTDIKDHTFHQEKNMHPPIMSDHVQEAAEAAEEADVDEHSHH